MKALSEQAATSLIMFALHSTNNRWWCQTVTSHNFQAVNELAQRGYIKLYDGIIGDPTSSESKTQLIAQVQPQGLKYAARKGWVKKVKHSSY